MNFSAVDEKQIKIVRSVPILVKTDKKMESYRLRRAMLKMFLNNTWGDKHKAVENWLDENGQIAEGAIPKEEPKKDSDVVALWLLLKYINKSIWFPPGGHIESISKFLDYYSDIEDPEFQDRWEEMREVASLHTQPNVKIKTMT